MSNLALNYKNSELRDFGIDYNTLTQLFIKTLIESSFI